jgi:nucleoside-diphosphate-sugar epimerase
VDGATINIGSGREVSILELVASVLEVTGAETEAIYNPKASGGVDRMRADITRAEALLGYQPQFSLREGLAQTLELDPRFQPRE